MIELNEIESKFLELSEKRLSLREFERWVYESKWLEKELTTDEYTDLISLNYGTPSSIYDAEKILKERIDEGKLESVKMIELLNSIIERNGKEGESLIKMYDLYCKGYYFLEDLGLGIGLQIELPSNTGEEYYHDLNDKQKKELADRVYPIAKELAMELKNWILNGELKLTGFKDLDFNRWQYIDNRTNNDKKSRVWIVEDVDKETGEIRSKRNTLLDDGYFIS